MHKGSLIDCLISTSNPGVKKCPISKTCYNGGQWYQFMGKENIFINPLPIRGRTKKKKAFENIVGEKGENAGDQHFLLFPTKSIVVDG